MRRICLYVAGSLALCAAPSVVNKSVTTCTATSGTSMTCAMAASVTSGNTLHVGVDVRAGTGPTVTVSSITDSLGTTLASAVNNNGLSSGSSTANSTIFCGTLASSGADTITVNFSGTGLSFAHTGAWEISGGTCTTDGTTSNYSNAGTNITSCGANITTTVDNDIMLATAYSNDTTNTLTAGTGFSMDLQHVSGSTRQGIWESKVVAAHGSTVVNVTTISTSMFSCAGVAFKAAAVPPPSTHLGHKVTQGGLE